MIIGAQLYTVRNYTQSEKDIMRTLARIAKIGYTTVQVSAIGKIAPQRLKEICDQNGLKIVLTHTNPDRVLNETEAVIEEHNRMGCDYIGIGAMPERYRTEEWLDMFGEDFSEPARKIAAAGKKLMYHNHNFEFAKIRGKRIMDWLMEMFTPEEMGFTLDTYWVQAGGADIYQWIDKLSGRLPVIHLKDMTVQGFEHKMAPVGEGNLNFEAIYKAFAKAGTQYMMVEQDICEGSPFDCLQISYDNLKKAGFH